MEMIRDGLKPVFIIFVVWAVMMVCYCFMWFIFWVIDGIRMWNEGWAEYELHRKMEREGYD